MIDRRNRKRVCRLTAFAVIFILVIVHFGKRAEINNKLFENLVNSAKSTENLEKIVENQENEETAKKSLNQKLNQESNPELNPQINQEKVEIPPATPHPQPQGGDFHAPPPPDDSKIKNLDTYIKYQESITDEKLPSENQEENAIIAEINKNALFQNAKTEEEKNPETNNETQENNNTNNSISESKKLPSYPDVYNEDTLKIRQVTTSINFDGKVYNTEKFKRNDSSDPVFVVQTHNRSGFLKILLHSLSKVKNIEKALLIISSDLYDLAINEEVSKIDFCQFQHIFYPFSAAWFPKQFPGTDPNDCDRDVKKPEALRLNCNNAQFPDKYGHYREAKYVQLKHHWMWKLQYVFKVVLPDDTESSVILLEDDYYMSPDILVVNDFLRSQEKELHPGKKNFDLISLGNYEKKQVGNIQTWKSVQYQYDVQTFYASSHNMGMSLNRRTFDKIYACRKSFCIYDDYNWDWTLQNMISTCMLEFKTLVAVAPRVFHLGACVGPEGGTHVGKIKTACDLEGIKNKFSKYAEQIPTDIGADVKFKPRKLTDPKRKTQKANGGWGDPRDHALCMDYNLVGMGKKKVDDQMKGFE